MPLDPTAVRAHFPALASDWAFFDNAGGSQTLGEVGVRISRYLYESMVAQGGPYEASRLGQERLDNATRRFATFLNAADPGEVVLGSSTTQLLQNLGHSLLETFRPGDRVVITQAEHQSNVDPWQRFTDAGIDVVRWNVNADSWRLELDELEPLLNDRTRLVAFTHCSNILGTVHDVAAMTRFIHERGAQVLVDGVAYAPHDALDVQAWDVDYYVFSIYKTYGPHLAALYGKRRHLLDLPPANFRVVAADRIPYKFQPGNANPELSHGATAVVDYLQNLATQAGGEPADSSGDARQALAHSWSLVRQHEQALSARLVEWLTSHRKVALLGLADADRRRRVPTFSFVLEGSDSQEVVRRLARHELAARAGNFYALDLGEAFDFARTNGVIRISLVHYNTLDEVDRLLQCLDGIVSGSQHFPNG